MNFDRSANDFVFSLMEALEERVLFDGVPDGMLVLPAAEANQAPAIDAQSQQQADVDSPRELVVIDAAVENHQALLQSILDSNSDSILDVRVIDGSRDGVAQISAILEASDEKFDAIHIVSHGKDGQVQLGSNTLSEDNLALHADAIASWATALTDDADLLFYGCNLAESADGEAFIQTVAGLTGADVAASDDLTGNQLTDGDLELEVNFGDVQTQSLLRGQAAAALMGTLDITGVVFEDFNNNGVQDDGVSNAVANEGGTGSVAQAVDSGVAGIVVNAYDENENLVDSATTDATGAYSLTTGSGVFRLEFSLTGGFFDGQFGASSSGSVQFVNDGSIANLGIHRPDNYSTDNPLFVTNCYVLGDQINGNNADRTVLVSFQHSAGSDRTETSAAGYLAGVHGLEIPASEIGTTWGLTYDRQEGELYTSAFTKKHAGYGPDGTGAIYQIDVSNGDVDLFADLNAIFGADTAGANFRAGYAAGDAPYETDSFDIGWDAVGKTSLGGIALSDDGDTLYVMNLADRSLYALNTDGTLDASNTRRQVIPVAADATGTSVGNPLGDLRPFAVTEYQGKLYVGVVNSAESTQLSSDLKAYIYEVVDDGTNLTFSAAPVFEMDLDYTRDGNLFSGVLANWEAWTPNFADNSTNAQIVIKPQPWLTDISFDENGNMSLGIVSRDMHQTGNNVFSDPNNPTDRVFGYVDGETLRAFVNTSGDVSSGWTLEDNGRGPNGEGAGPQNNDFGPGGGEFYYEDSFKDPNFHPEVGLGGLAHVAGFNQLLTTVVDPGFGVQPASDGFLTQGIHFYDNSDGSIIKAHQLTTREPGNPPPVFGKAGGLGDIEAILAVSPMEIGDRIWFDENADGIQGAAEAVVSDGVTVQLYDMTNPLAPVLVGTTTTASGQYLFNDTNVTYSDGGPATGLRPLTDYEVRLVATDFQSGGLLQTYQATIANNAADGIDSDATTVGGVPVIALTTGESGASNHSYDIGLVSTDFGDLPDGYDTTTAAGGPVHLISGLTLGASVDGESDGQPSADATGDGADEDGVTFTSPLVAGTNASMTVTASAAGYLNAWIDFDSNGSLDEIDVTHVNGVAVTGATNVDDLLLNAGANVIRFDVPADAEGNMAARFRLTADAMGGARSTTGLAPSGEVEDYVLGSIGDRVFLDNGAGTGGVGNDGVQNGTEPGVANVTVYLLNSAGVRLLDAAGNPISTMTDADGLYEFSGLPVGDYRVEFVAPTGFYLAKTNQGGDALDSDADQNTGVTTQTYTIAANTTIDTVDAGLTTRDRGDLPVGFNVSTADGGPSHTLDGATYLGTSVDAENDATNTGDASGDGADENGVTFLTPLTAGDNATVRVNASTAGFLNAWIDFNGNGVFNAGEQIATNLALTAGDNDITVAVPATATGAMAARFRFTSDNPAVTTPGTPLVPDGHWDNGEVEDYILGAIGNYVWEDNGAGAGTATDGIQDASETAVSGVTVYLLNGAGVRIPDADGNPISTTTDGAGRYEFAGLPAGNYQVEFVAPTSYSFTQANAGSDDAFDSDADIATGITATTNLTPGEVDDSLDAGLVRFDYGDLDDGYGTTDATTGARHVLDGTTFLGANVDAESDGQPSANATGDGSDENGVVFTSPLTAGASATIEVTASADGFLNAWIDFDSDGSLDEVLVTHLDGVALGTPVNIDDLALTTGTTELRFDVPATAEGNMAARFRYTADAMGAGRSTTGTASSGEVEDYVLGSIGDYVFADANNDGLLTGGETPVSGVTVYLLNGAGVRINDAAGNPISTTTDGAGLYEFAGLPVGNYRVEFVAPAGTYIAKQNQGLDDAVDSDADQTTGITGVYSIVANSTIGTVDAGLTTRDRGDLPAGYNVSIADGGPSHTLDGATYLGAGVDSEDDATNSVDALGDGADENGVTFLTPLSAGETALVRVVVNGAGDSYLSGWIDFNADGTLDEIDVLEINGVAAGAGTTLNQLAFAAGTYTLKIDVPTTATGAMAARFRLTADFVATPGGLGVDGHADSGEVEDYLLGAIGDYVWEDNGVGGGIAGDGVQDSGEPAIEGVVVYLLDGTGTRIQNADGAFISTTTDVDGIYEFAGLPPDDYAVEFVAPTDYSFTAADAGSDDLADSDASPATGRTAAINITAGEIDSSLDAGLVLYDYGDLPDVYGTTNASAAGAARHVIDGVTFLGAGVDLESDGQPAADATGDGVDEDGVAFTSPLVAGRPATVEITTSADGFLNAWIDFDSSGSLDEVLVTHVDGVALAVPTNINDLALLAGTTELRFDVPATAEGTMAARFRYTSAAMGGTRGTTGSAASGEVEDYVLGAIGDRVWRDNGLGLGGVAADGIQNGTEAGIAGVRVYLLDSAGVRIDDAAGNPIFTTTDATGGYEFAGLPADDYRVEFVLVNAGDAFTNTNAGSDDAADSDAATNGITPQIYTINAGTNDTSVDAGIVELEIGNRVWFDSDRDGLQEVGELSVSSVTLDLFDVSDPLNPVLVGTEVTDVMGEYYFNSSNVVYPDTSIGLRPGTNYEVRMRATDFAGGVLDGFNVTTQDAGVDNAIDSDAIGIDADGDGLDDGGVISLTTGAAGTLNYSYDIGLNPTGSIGDLVFIDIDGDNVLDAVDGDTGLGGVTVTLTYTDPILGGGPITMTTTTAIDGTYLFAGLPGDVTYKVTVDQSTLGAMHPDDIRQSSDPDAVLDGMSMVTLNTVGNDVTDDLDQDFGYVPLGVIGDTVWYDTDRDGAQDAGELGIQGVTVRLTSGDGYDLDPALAGVQTQITDVTDIDGHYLFVELPAGDYTVEVISGIPAHYVQTGDPDAVLDYTSMLTLNLSADVPPEVIGNMLQDFGVVAFDYGDLPVGYGTTVADGGAAHVIIGDTFLGANIDSEADGAPTADATGDGGDENGVVFTSPLVAGISATIDVTANADGFLNAWIDFDSNGTLDEVFVTHVDGVLLAVPTAINDLALTTGTTTLRFDVPATAEGNMAARFRYTEDAMGVARSTTGIWNNGEVEDYVLGSIGDRVFLDSDNDGVQDPGEGSVDAVTVYLLDAAGDRIDDAAGNPISTTTDSAGLYEFAGLPVGSYRVEFVAPAGYFIAKTNQGLDDGVDSDASQADGRTIQTYTIGANTTIDSVDAGLTTRDRGDLPVGFNVSAADGGPSHTLDGVNYLGASVDGEADAANTADASGDGADENGVTFLTPLTAGDNATVRVNASTAGFLNAWIDFNGNGAFDGGEQIATNLAVASGDNDIVVAVPSDATGAMAARFRFTADDPSTTPAGSIGPDGHWDNGEVEDYILGAVGNYVWEDNGAGAGEAYDGIQNGSEPAVQGVRVYLLNGAGTRLQDADGEDIFDTTDSNGFYEFAGLPPSDYAVEFVAPIGFEFTSSNQGADGTVDSDAAESGGNIGQTAAVNLTAGEIDNTLDAGLVEFDYGDLSDGYGTTNGSLAGAAKHVVDDVTFLGAGVDAEADGQPNAGATGDDDNVDDEDGVVFLTPLMPGASANVRVNASVDGFLNAWIDFDSNGTLDEVTVTAIDGVALTVATTIRDLVLTAGETTLTIEVPATADANMAARFRFTADEMGVNRSANNAWGNGEVEDYVLGSLGDFVFLDNGDGAGGTAKDGVQNGAEAGVGGVVVTLLNAAEEPITDADGNRITTTTAADGTYQFVGLPAGDYKVQFGQPGSLILTDANQGGDDGLDSDADVATGITSQTYTIGPNVTDVSVDAGLLEVDFGDLPDVYATRSVDDGARHALDGVTFLGSSVDGEGNGVPTADATGDDVAGTADDENGVTFLTPLVPGRPATIQVEASAAGYLNAWIDFNSDGMLNEVTVTAIAGPSVVTGSAMNDIHLSAAGTYTFTIDVPANAEGTMATRFRYTADAMGADRATTGLARTGEVEDYVLGAIGDVVFLDNGNGGGIGSDGQQNGTEAGVADVTVRLLNVAGVAINDADGNPITTVTAADGSYEFSGLPAGTYKVGFDLPNGYQFTDADAGSDTTDSDANETTGVTDQTFTIVAGTRDATVDAGLLQQDFGDLPDSYDTLATSGGAVHGIDGATYLGAGVDAELDGQPSTDALGDDATDDEDGVLFLDPIVAGTTARVQVTASTAGFLNAWIDFNGNGLFDGGERIATDTAMVAGVNVVTVNVPVTATGVMGARFRFTNDNTGGALDSTGAWDNGEVEDYLLGSIGNYVWEDNGAGGGTALNGIQDTGEPAFIGVVVYLLDGIGDRVTDSAGNDIQTTTDVNGLYEFAGLPAGDYAVEFVAPTGYSFTQVNGGSDDALDSDANLADGKTAAVTLVPGGVNETLDAGVARFDFGDLVDGYGTTNAVNGARHVVDGVTFLGATVDSESDGVPTADATGDGTDEDGVVFNSPLTAGSNAEFSVTASTAGFLNAWIDFNSDGTLDEISVTHLNGTAIPAGTNVNDLLLAAGANTIRFDVPADATGNMAARFRLTANPMGTDRSTTDTALSGEVEDYVLGSIGDKVFADANNDGLQTAGETPVEGVTVYLLNSTGVRLTDAAGDLISTVTDAAGTYEFAGLPVGDYRVEFVAPVGTYIAKPNQLTDDAVDSDANALGVTGIYAVGANSTIDTVDAGLTTRDRGDLPAAFNVSLADNGPSHTLDGTTYLGASVDGEADAANTANAQGDDGVGSDDEDGVVFTTPLVAGTTAAIEVTANTAGFLNAWVDFNGNGIIEGGEQIASDRPLAAGANTVNVNVPTDATGVMAVRFRFTSDNPAGALTPDGHWDNGEVEDYVLNSIGNLVFEDDGDGIQEPGEAPRAGVTLYLKDATGNRIQDANGDDISTVTDGAGQYEFTGLPDGTYTIEIVLPTDYGVSTQNAGTDDALDSDIDPAMLMSDPVTVGGGESDDSVDVGLVQFDYGDLPTAYGQTTLADDGARHIVDGVTFLGAGVDVDSDGLHSANALADDGVGDDEDGVVFLTPLVPGTSADVQVQAGSDGYLNGWIDFDSDGTLSEVTVTAVDGIVLATPITISDLNLTNGTHRLTIDVPANATGTMAARFRFTSDAMGAARSTDGQWDNGEVEDYVLGAIGDRVFFDNGAGTTGNGVQDAGENGVVGVNVYLLNSAGARIQDAAGGDIVAVTDANGLYEFPGLPAGDYRVEFELPADHFFTVNNRGGDEVADSDPNLITGVTDQTYTIVAGQINNDVDAGILQAASLGDRIWFDIDADGVQDSDEPGFENIDVRIEVDIDDDGTPDYFETTTTGPNGIYDFPSLPPGTVVVSLLNPPPGYRGTFSADGGPTDTYTGSLDPNQDRENVDFGLTGNSSLAGTVHEDGVDDATEPFQIDGVQDPGEPGIPNVTITLNGITTGGLVFSKTTTTDGNGDYSFGDLPPGTYSIVETQPTSSPITASSPNYVDGLDRQGSLAGNDPGNTLTNDTLAGINLGINEDGVNYDFSEIPEARTDGYVFVDDNDNGIFDPGEQGIPGVTVTLTGTDVFGTAVTETATTDAGGFYEFTGLYAGTYTLTETQPTSFTDGQEQNGSRPVLVSNDSFNNLPLTWGDNTFSYNFGEIQSGGTSGYPPTLPPLFFAPPFRISNFIPPGPGPIYTGDQIFTNSNPLSLDSGLPVAGGYSIDRGVSEDCDCECSCEEIVETPVCEPVVVPCDDQATPFIGGLEPSILEHGDGVSGESSESVSSEEVASEENTASSGSGDQVTETGDSNVKPPIPNHVLAKPSFLKRMSNWFVG